MFTTDSRTENFLNSIGVQWSYNDSLLIANLEPNWSRHNLGRQQNEIDDAVLEYAHLMQKGSPAPAPIVRGKRGEEVQVLDGVQRLLAAELSSHTHYSGYLVDTSPIMTKKVRIIANARLQGGYQETKDWTLQQAVQLLIIDEGISVQEVADLGGWAVSKVRDKQRILEYKSRLRGIGIEDSITDRLVRLIAEHADPEDFGTAPQAIYNFVNDISRMKLTGDEAQPYVEEFFSVARNKPKLHDQFNRKLQQFHGDDYIAGRLRNPLSKCFRSYTPDGKLMQALKSALTTAKKTLDAKESLVEEMETYYQVVNSIKTVLQRIEAKQRG